jgi:hypothetical protein
MYVIVSGQRVHPLFGLARGALLHPTPQSPQNRLFNPTRGLHQKIGR